MDCTRGCLQSCTQKTKDLFNRLRSWRRRKPVRLYRFSYSSQSKKLYRLWIKSRSSYRRKCYARDNCRRRHNNSNNLLRQKNLQPYPQWKRRPSCRFRWTCPFQSTRLCLPGSKSSSCKHLWTIRLYLLRLGCICTKCRRRNCWLQPRR